MKAYLLAPLALSLGLFFAAPLSAADDLAQCQNYMVATELKFKYCYQDKVAAERELEELKRQYANERTALKERIRELERELENLRAQLAAMTEQLKQEQDNSSQRIAELEKTIALLQAKSTGREKDLLEANQELERRFNAQIAELQRQLKEQADKNQEKVGALDEEIAKLMREVSNLNQELDRLKQLTKSQKAELERLKAQEKELAQQLEQEIQNGEIRLKKFHDKLTINIDNRISFDSGSAKLKKAVFPAFQKIAKILANYPENRIVIEGHTDNDPIARGRFKDNWDLSAERALSVLRYLLKNKDLDPKRFSAAGYAEFQPLVPNDSASNKGLNRRVDIVLLPRVK